MLKSSGEWISPSVCCASHDSRSVDVDRTYYSQTRHCAPDRHWQTVHKAFFFLVADLFFPALRQMKWLAYLLPFVNPHLTACLVSLLTWNKAAITALKLQMLFHIIWNKAKIKKNQAETLCRLLFVRFWVIRLFMWAGTPRQWNNDMSLQVVCRVFLGFWRGLHGEVSKGGGTGVGPLRSLQYRDFSS